MGASKRFNSILKYLRISTINAAPLVGITQQQICNRIKHDSDFKTSEIINLENRYGFSSDFILGKSDKMFVWSEKRVLDKIAAALSAKKK